MRWVIHNLAFYGNSCYCIGSTDATADTASIVIDVVAVAAASAAVSVAIL